jgi:hypothetical protein
MADRICAWCGKILERDIDTEKDSHGICKRCRRKLLKDIMKKKKGGNYDCI